MGLIENEIQRINAENYYLKRLEHENQVIRYKVEEIISIFCKSLDNLILETTEMEIEDKIKIWFIQKIASLKKQIVSAL